MKRQFSWPTRAWNKNEAINLLYMFCPQSDKYQEYMRTIEMLHKNELIQENLYVTVQEMNDGNSNSEYQVIEYKTLRGSFQQRVSEPCSGLGQLLIQGRSRIQYIDLNNRKVIGVRPYGDVRVVDDIIALAIHLSLIVYDETSDSVQLTEYGKEMIDYANDDSKNWWQETLLRNPVVVHILRQVKYGTEKSQDHAISLLEIGDNTGFYDGMYYNAETYVGHMYTCDNKKECVPMNVNVYIAAALSALENESLVISCDQICADQTMNGNSIECLLHCYTITGNGEEQLFSKRNLIMPLLLLLNGASDKGDEVRRGMLLSLLTLSQTKDIGGLSMSAICDFFPQYSQMPLSTIMLDIFGFLRIGISIMYKADDDNVWIPMTIFDIPKLRKLDMASIKFWSPIEVIGTELNFSNPRLIANMSKMKHEFLPYLNRNYRYLSLIDHWNAILKHQIPFADEELHSFNQLFADLIYHNMDCCPYIFYNKEIPSYVISVIICYNKNTNEFLVVDTSSVFRVQNDTNLIQTNVTLIDEPECSFHSAAQEYVRRLTKEQKRIVSEQTIAESKCNFGYKQIESFITNSCQVILNDINPDKENGICKDENELYELSEKDQFNYLVLYHENLNQISETYHEIFESLPLFEKMTVSYMDWMQFIGKCTGGQDFAFIE